MLHIELPIYVMLGKRKQEKIFVGMNWYRRAQYHQQNSVRVYYENLIIVELSKLKCEKKRLSRFRCHYHVNLKNPNSDPSNVVALIEKFWLDALQKAGLVESDSVKYHAGSCWESGVDKKNPGVFCSLLEV